MAKAKTVPKKRGRPTKLTPEVAAEVCGYIKNGLTDGDAAVLTGITPQLFCQWKRQGEAGDEPYAQFLSQLRAAELEFKQYHLSLIAKHGKKSAPASEWLLERKFSNEFGQKQKIEVIDKLAEWTEGFDKV